MPLNHSLGLACNVQRIDSFTAPTSASGAPRTLQTFTMCADAQRDGQSNTTARSCSVRNTCSGASLSRLREDWR